MIIVEGIIPERSNQRTDVESRKGLAVITHKFLADIEHLKQLPNNSDVSVELQLWAFESNHTKKYIGHERAGARLSFMIEAFHVCGARGMFSK
jgi:hypothetical protein